MKNSSNARPKAIQQPTVFGGGFPIPMPPLETPLNFTPEGVPEPANDQVAPKEESLLTKRRRRKARLAGRHH